ncbi:MAG: ornithine cyclodeaminase family protein [Pseudomonadota bacterium]
MLMLDAEEVARRLPWGALIEALDAMFCAGCDAPLRHRHAAGETSLLLMPAWRASGDKGGGHTGVKIVHVAPGNAARGLAAVNAAYLLSDAETGVPRAMLDGGMLTDRRTAATSVLAARHLARPDAARLLLMGSGRVAHALAEAYRDQFPITDITIWSPRHERAEALATRLAAHGHPARAVTRPEPGAADIISCATLATAPLIRGGDLREGVHLDLVGAYRPDMREADGAALARARLVVDTRAGSFAEAGDLLQAIAEGAITQSHVAGELAELCRGEIAGRQAPAQITAFKSVGWAGEDLAAAILACGAD